MPYLWPLPVATVDDGDLAALQVKCDALRAQPCARQQSGAGCRSRQGLAMQRRQAGMAAWQHAG